MATMAITTSNSMSVKAARGLCLSRTACTHIPRREQPKFSRLFFIVAAVGQVTDCSFTPIPDGKPVFFRLKLYTHPAGLPRPHLVSCWLRTYACYKPLLGVRGDSCKSRW